MPGTWLKRLLGLTMAALLFFSAATVTQARPSWLPDNSRGGASRPGVSSQRQRALQEVSPPGGADQLRRSLANHRPVLRLLSPADGSVINKNSVELTLGVDDWPLVDDPVVGLGPHVVVQIDEREPLRVTHAEDGRIVLTIDDLEPGSHRFSAWAAYPWGEPSPRPEASVQWRLHQWQELRDRQPGNGDPWLVTVHPPEDRVLQPLPLNWLIWNSPLQNLRDNDERWRLRISIDGDSFLVNRAEGIWVKAPTTSQGLNVQMELLDGQGESLDPVFNNQLLRLKPTGGMRPSWLKAKLSDDELARFTGTSRPQEDAEPVEDDNPADSESVAEESDSPEQEIAPPAEDIDTLAEADDPTIEEPLMLEEPVQSTPADGGNADAGEPEEELQNRPVNSLGGSARELLTPDGRLRNP